MTNNTKLLVLMVAIVAFAVGALFNSTRVDDNVNPSAILAAKLDGAADQQTVGQQLEALTLVNFWASWCRPCRKEMPVFEALYQGNKASGFHVIGIAIDSPDKTRAMLDSMGISYPILYAEQSGMQLMESAGNPDGFLPYSLLLNEDGEVLEQVLGQIHEQQIVDWIGKYL